MAAVLVPVTSSTKVVEALSEGFDLAESSVHSATTKLICFAWRHRTQYLLQIVHFDQSDSDSAINTANDCGVVACW